MYRLQPLSIQIKTQMIMNGKKMLRNGKKMFRNGRFALRS